ncbi:hypothetical protein Snoj_26600 [Streptomyces nojiriensis]|uniref:Uncharacterized protein n=1 Tax=Streptomyces nojiriensis TaxID=66374 RepID=A0ABQ3SKS2_9ACTN|nr:hypothetical protein [Streptomyces nojiriensis]QTI50321.1 hypothetical protein JYK04_08198 [Streptomyces nojiriensis]GGS29967.1 hypothetical protein GCM10010205_70200 [Streptomyces nojiriensis]GHI68742.1 hypothetical protein Snoj_26600 [Streptomyces nojiriensis]
MDEPRPSFKITVAVDQDESPRSSVSHSSIEITAEGQVDEYVIKRSIARAARMHQERLKDLWSYQEIAAHLRVQQDTVRSYHEHGLLPPHDYVEGDQPYWYGSAIRAWAARRSAVPMTPQVIHMGSPLPERAERRIALALIFVPMEHRERYRQEWVNEMAQLSPQEAMVSALHLLLLAPKMGMLLMLGRIFGREA